MFFNNYVALDITGNEIRILAVKGGKFTKWASAPLPDGVVKAGIVREPRAMGVIIDNLFKSLKLPKNRVLCTVSGLPFIYRTISMPCAERIPTEAVERESRREMSVGKEDMYLTWQVTETHQTTREVDYFVVGVPRTSLNPVIDALSRAGIKQYLVDIKPLALARVTARKEAIIISVEADNIDVVIVVDRLVRVIHSFNPGEKSKETIGLINEIADGLNKAIKSFERDFREKTLSPETPILLCGRLAPDDPILSLVEKATGRTVSILKPSLKVPAGMPVGLYASGLGLASRRMGAPQRSGEYQEINLDLLKGLKRLNTRNKFQLAWVLAAVLSLALAGLVYESHELKSNAADQVLTLQQKADRLKLELIEAQRTNRQTLQTKTTLEDKSKTAVEQLTAIKRSVAVIESQRVDLGAQIAIISANILPGAEFSKIDIQSNRIEVMGKAKNEFDVLQMADNLEKCSIFSKVRVEQLGPAEQDAIAFQLAISNRVAAPISDSSGAK